ncbi:IS110 family transposase [Arthrobacter sp. D1-29]
MTDVFCGIDWAEGPHDISVVDQQGQLLASRRIEDTAASLTELLEMLGALGDRAEDPIPVAIETTRCLLVAALRSSGRDVYAINPMAASRYRDRHTVSSKKSDAQDAAALANILRTDRHAHRPMPKDSELVQAIAVLARAQQDAVWERQQETNRIRSLLREYYPSALRAFPNSADLASPVARALLGAVSNPCESCQAQSCPARSNPAKAGRTRSLETTIDKLYRSSAAPISASQPWSKLRSDPASTMLGQLDAVCQGLESLTAAVEKAFHAHPDAQTLVSFPGLGSIAGARILAEIGDDRTRFTTASALKAYAGAAPVTRANGKSHTVLARRVKNNRLAAAGYIWAFSALTNSAGARAHYDRRKKLGDRHTAAQRNLFNRLLRCLHHCLQASRTYNESAAFPVPQERAASELLSPIRCLFRSPGPVADEGVLAGRSRHGFCPQSFMIRGCCHRSRVSGR